MRISEYVESTAEAENRSAPDATPENNANAESCNYGTAAFTKIAEPVKSVDSAIFIKTDHAASRMPAEEVNATPVKDGGCAAFAKIGKAIATPVKISRSYCFVTLAKIGYAVRVKCLYRVVPRMSDDAETIISVYPTDSPQIAGLRESDDGDKLIHGQDVGMPLKNECRDSYKLGFLTFARIGYVVRVKVLYRIGQFMADPQTKSRIIMYTKILAKNARNYARQNNYKFDHGGAAIFIIICGTLIEVVSKEMADSPEQHVSGSQEFITGVEMHGKAAEPVPNCGHDWFSDAYKGLKDMVGAIPLNEILAFMVREFRAFLRKEPFRSRIFSKQFLTMESLAFMMREFFVYMMKQLFGAQFFSHIDEIIVAVMRDLFNIDLVNESGFHGSAMKGGKKKGMHKY
ncbi:uncharacterized protein LOC131013216 [Salvia miltiorrhiza]|uniref:uncharacterized protein LOC131013216 n=1 Tax=Salvia miltiorrhiza TaxID=226208 RepID=UPI0025AC4A11|nr:uncharacterized protein LOC131013216 [Salvia miltiorrhiza]